MKLTLFLFCIFPGVSSFGSRAEPVGHKERHWEYITHVGLNFNLPFGPVDFPSVILQGSMLDPSLAGFSMTSSTSWQAGAAVRYRIGRERHFYFEGGLQVYDRKVSFVATRAPATSNSPGAETRRIYNACDLDLPLSMGYRYKRWELSAGVRFSYLKWGRVRSFADEELLEARSNMYTYPWRDKGIHPFGRLFYRFPLTKRLGVSPWVGAERRDTINTDVTWWDVEFGVAITL